MRRLITQEDTTGYAGFFLHPAFALWSGGVRIIEGLYHTFNEYGAGLDDIKLETTPESSSPVVKVDLGDLGDYKVSFEQVEWEVSNIDGEDFARVPEILGRGEKWLRSITPDFAFKLHGLTYYSHNLLSEGTSGDLLRGVSNVDIPDVGASLGTGLMFHWQLPKEGWRMNLIVDHSNLYTDGLFLEQEVFVLSDEIDYTKLVISSRKLLADALTKIGLEFGSDE
jgi:hypothetical protein